MKQVDEIWNAVSSTITRYMITARLGLTTNGQTTEWSSWLTQPSPSYVEGAGWGPIEKSKVLWIEINPIETKRVGKLASAKQIDHTDDVRSALTGHCIEIQSDNHILLRLID